MLQNGYILNIDVLGFGSFVKSNSTQTVFDHYAGLITGADYAGVIVNEGNIDVMVYSDTIAIKSHSTVGQKSLVDLVQISNIIQLRQYYSSLSVESTFLPIRGTITHGEFIFHKGDLWTQAIGKPKIYARNVAVIIGKPIVESYEAEKKMELMCVAIATSALEQADTSTLSALIDSNILLRYDIPLKGGKTTPGVVVNPVSTAHFDINISKLKHESAKHALGSSTHRKYMNTIELFSFVKDAQRFYPKLPE